MNDTFSHSILSKSRELLDELFEAVKSEEGTLAGGTKLGTGGEALQSLRETRICFGNPKDRLIRLNKKLFKDLGLELSPVYKEQMKEQFDFYYMTLAVSMQPGRGVQFSRIESALDFGPKGLDEPIVQTIFPTSEWRELLRFGRQMSVGLDGNFSWKAGTDTSDIPMMEAIPGQLKTNIESKNKMNAFVTIPDFCYELGKNEIAAAGQGNSECFWRIEKPELKKNQNVQFGVVFKVPKGITSIELTAKVLAEPHMGWLTANLRDVFEFLSDRLKKVLLIKDDERKGVDRLPVGDHEQWKLDLPR